MIHGPCGPYYNLNSPCMELKDNTPVCSKRYPKPEVEKTKVDGTNYPEYRRMPPEKGGRYADMVITVDGERQVVRVSNQFVVPYNPFLLLKLK